MKDKRRKRAVIGGTLACYPRRVLFSPNQMPLYCARDSKSLSSISPIRGERRGAGLNFGKVTWVVTNRFDAYEGFVSSATPHVEAKLWSAIYLVDEGRGQCGEAALSLCCCNHSRKGRQTRAAGKHL